MQLDSALQVHQGAAILYNEDAVERAIAMLAQRVADDSDEDFPLLLCVMNGGLYLSGQLLRHWSFPLTLDYVHATRYRLATLGKDVLWKAYPQNELKDRNVIIVDDIFDTASNPAGFGSTEPRQLINDFHGFMGGFIAEKVIIFVSDLTQR